MKPLFLPLFLSAALLTAGNHPATTAYGPTRAPIRGASKVALAPIWVAYGTRSVLRNLPGATISVEDSLPEFLPAGVVLLPFRAGNARFEGGNKAVQRGVVPAPDWMTPTVIMAGPNVVQRSYAFGGVVF